MTEPLPDVELSVEQQRRALALWTNSMTTNRDTWLAARLIVHLQDDAERWRTYLKCYDREEMVAAEWAGPAAITAYVDQQRAASTTGDALK